MPEKRLTEQPPIEAVFLWVSMLTEPDTDELYSTVRDLLCRMERDRTIPIEVERVEGLSSLAEVLTDANGQDVPGCFWTRPAPVSE